jgi:hypothetical protein
MHKDFKFESTIRFPEKTLVFQNEEDRDKIDKLILQAVDNIIFSGVPGLTSQSMRTWDYNAKFNSFAVSKDKPYKIIMDTSLIPEHVNFTKEGFIEWFNSLGVKIIKNEDYE